MNRYKLVSAIGEGSFPITAFDCALLKSGIGNYNLIKVSSILSPGSTQEEKIDLPLGSLLPTAYAHIKATVPGEQITAVVSVGIPDDCENGVIMEHSGVGDPRKIVQECESMVKEAFALRKRPLKAVHTEFATTTYKDDSACICAFAAIAMW